MYQPRHAPCVKLWTGLPMCWGSGHFRCGYPAAWLALALSRNLSRLLNRRLAGIHQTVKKWMAEDVYDSRLFNRTFDFTVQTSIKEGIRKEVEWYRRNAEM